MRTVKIRQTASVLLLVTILLGACRDKEARKSKSPAQPTIGSTQRAGTEPAMARWLRRIPADARWAVVSVELSRLRSVLADLATLLAHHPRLAPVLAQWRAELKRKWGAWPLRPEIWSRLALTPGSGGAVYGLADGATVLQFRTPALGKLLETIKEAIRRRGARQISDVKPLRVAGGPAFRIDQWICASRGGLATCANVPLSRFAALTTPPKKNLWRHTLSRVHSSYLRERLGFWVQDPGVVPGLHAAAGQVLGRSPKGLWLALSLGRRLQVRGLALGGDGPQATGKTASGTTLPKPGHSGLAAAQSAPLVIRLRLPPNRLGDHLLRLVPALRPVLEILRKKQPRGGTLSQQMLSGEVVLMSDHTGVAAILGLRSRSRGLRAMKKLMLLLTPRLSGWQKQLRGRGRGWDLSYTGVSLGDVPAHRLIFQVPPDAGPGTPNLRNGRLTVLWGVAQRHVVVATDANLFRRILARVDQPDSHFLRRLPDATGRRGFADHRLVSIHMRPDDPLYALPPKQRAAARLWLTELGPGSRLWATRIRTLMDLTDSLSLSCEQLGAGVGCHLGVSLLLGAGTPKKPRPVPRLQLDVKYREALIKKWGGNRDGHLRLLRSLARLPGTSPLRAKASRMLAHRRGVPNAGLEGLLVSVWLPWARHRLVIAARQEAPRELHRLAKGLTALAARARTLPASARRRWYRGLHSTRITPTRSCCKGGVRRCKSRPADWSHQTWRRLGFHLSGPHVYRYQLTVEPGSLRSRVVISATGDLNCNGRSSLLQQRGTIDSATGALRMGPVTRVRADD